MNVFLSLVLKEARHILRDQRTMLILFGMPVVMMLLFGFALSTEVRNVRVVVAAPEPDALTVRLTEVVEASDLFVLVGTVPSAERAQQVLANSTADVALIFGAGLASNLTTGREQIQIVTDGSDPNMARQYAQYLRQTLMQHMAQDPDNLHLVVYSGQSGVSALAQAVNVRLLYNPRMVSAYNFVPGIMGLLLMLICAMMTSISVVREKERGSMELLLVSPVRPIFVILAKAVPYMLLALLILTAILLLARYVIGVPIVGGVGFIYVVSLIYIVVALALGMLISNVARTQMVALLFSAMVLLVPSLMLSGMIYPIESMPTILQWVSAIMPPRYYVAAMRKLMIMGCSPSTVLPEVGILCLMAVVILALALNNFKKRLE